MPVLDYAISAPAGQLFCTSVNDLPIPEFDNIGMEGVPAVQLFNSDLFKSNGSIKVDSILGYNPRYFNWKTNIDRVHGAYRDWETDRKSTRLNSSHSAKSRMPSSA